MRRLSLVFQIFLIDATFALFTERHQRAFELLSRTRVARDQQDLLFGLTVLLLRLVVTGTMAGGGLILLTAGSTEWELRSAGLPAATAPDPR